ncbi:hypothetical protein P5V15_003896 [Pogonomyrmex californicus]
MVTVQDIGLQLTKPVKELAQWTFPFSQTLEKYCSLFNTTCNQSFGEAGLVLQNSTAVYVHRIDSLWNKTEYCRNVLTTHEQEEMAKNSTRKRERKTDMCFKFKTVNFAEEVDKNIDIKKNHDIVKSKSRRFTQLEKGIAQHVSIDIYDVNGEIIGKKYDFRCNQNISMNGILVDEFAPQDFCCADISDKETFSSNYSNRLSCDTTADSVMHDDDNEDMRSERDNSSLEEDISAELITSLESSQQNLSLSTDIDTDNTLVKTPTNISSNNCDVTLINTSSEMCPNTPTDKNSSIMTNINNNISSNNNDPEDQCLNNNIKENIDVGSVLDSPPESVNSKGRRSSSTDDPMLLNDINGDLTKTKFINSVQNTPASDNKRSKRLHSTSKSGSKLLKRKLIASSKRQRSITKKNLFMLEDRPNMFKQNSSICMKSIREHDPLRYEDVTNAELDFLGFRLRVDTESDVNNDVTTNINYNVMTSIDDEISELHSPSPVDMSPPHENFYDVWFRSNSPHILSGNVDKWHEMIQPKLHDAEQRSTFCIRDYTSRIMETLKASDQQKINFNTVIQKERPCEVARYFLASLDLASKQNIDIKTNNDSNIEITLCEKNKQHSTCD